MKRFFAAVALTLACSSSMPGPYARASDAARAAYSRGDYRGAADFWAEAARRAPGERDREESTYRRAASLERARAWSEADALYAELERGRGERAARASFARARLVLRRGDTARGYPLLRDAALRNPDFGPARRALQEYLSHIQAGSGPDGALEEAHRLSRLVLGTELEESVGYARARLLERTGEPVLARDAYLALATRFPYPRGAYWDDALLAAARIEEATGEPGAAVRHLQRLLAERETARISGSYERATFAFARFRIAELYRDRLADARGALEEFRRVASDHPTSRLGDDALFEEALLAHRLGDAKRSCDAARRLLERDALSRFAACMPILCPRLERVTAAPPCRENLKQRTRTSSSASPGSEPYSSSR